MENREKKNLNLVIEAENHNKARNFNVKIYKILKKKKTATK